MSVNQVKDFDDAFNSRITLALEYDSLSLVTTRIITGTVLEQGDDHLRDGALPPLPLALARRRIQDPRLLPAVQEQR